MHRLIPEFIQEQYRLDQTSGIFDACALFVDISGFTAITDAIMGHGQYGAELLANIIGEVFDPLMLSVFEQGGFVTNLAGDAFTAVFPTERDPGDAIERALTAAWQIQQLVVTSPEHQTQYGTFAISVKVGIAIGEVAWGVISSPDKDRAIYYFQGAAIDGCADAEKFAQAGDLIMDSAVTKAVNSMVTAEPVGDHFKIIAFHGSPATPDTVQLQPVDPDIIRRFFPPEATQTTLSGEFRQVVSMFIGLPTMRTVDQLETFMQIIFKLLDRYGGLLNRVNFGDKGANLLLFWGAPIAHENDMRRALNFILDLQSQTVIPIQVGISYRIAHGGYSGGKLAGEYTCHGRGTTLAARLMEAAPRGEIWVDENIAAKAEDYYDLEFESEIAFKGFTNKQKVFVLHERIEETERLFEGRLVGRKTERELLFQFIKPIWQGSFCGALVVLGEPGIGKSRLVYDFILSLESSKNQEFSLFVCQTDEILRESLNPFRYWLRGYFGQSEQQSDARNKRSFNRKIDNLIASTSDNELKSELDRTRSFLGALVNLAWPDSLYEQLDAKGRYENSLTALLSLLRAESLRQPVVLLLEDAHWLDRDSTVFVKQLIYTLSRSPEIPLAILATARKEGDLDLFAGDGNQQLIDLGQLSPDDIKSLAKAQLGLSVNLDLLNLVVERSGGNPFFAEQILGYLEEEEHITLGENGWQLDSQQYSAMPGDISAILVARLDRLAQDIKDIVQTASILGREFEIRILTRMLNDDSSVRDKVAQAENQSIWIALNELRYIFKHVLLRDAAYHMQLRSRRQSLHGLALLALEQLYADDLSPHYGELAYHAELAQQLEKSRQYLELAGDAASKAYQNNIALKYYSQALAITPPDDLESRYRLVLATVRLHARLGARRDQAQALNQLSDLAQQLEDVSKQARSQIEKAWMYWWTADYAAAMTTSQGAIELAKAIEEHELIAEANHVVSWTLIQQGKYAEARVLSEQALDSAKQSGNQNLEANVYSSLGLIYRAEGDFYAGLKSTEKALAIDRKLESKHGEAVALGNLGVGLMTLGDYPGAKTCFQQALEISRQTGGRANVASDLINLCWHAETTRDWNAALQFGEEGIAIAHEVHQSEMEAEVLIWLGHAWLGLNHPHKALNAYQNSLRIRRELKQENLAMGVLAGMARAEVLQDDIQAALQYIEEIMTFLDSGGSLDGVWEPLRIYLTCFEVLQAVRDNRANALLETAYRKLQSWALKIPDDEVRLMFLKNIPWHREILNVFETRKG